VEAGSHAVEAVLAVVQDPGQIQAMDSRVRGILGADFLAHFDVLFDYTQSLLCLDEGKLMQANVKGARTALARVSHPDLPFTDRLIVPVNVFGIRGQLLMKLDSGSNAPMLYEAGKGLTQALFVSARLRTRGADGIEREFAVLPPQDVQIGVHVLHSVPFVAPLDAGKNVPKVDFDGLLPTILFRRVYISYADHYAVLDPW
jgi:hypothetical protein